MSRFCEPAYGPLTAAVVEAFPRRGCFGRTIDIIAERRVSNENG